MTYDIKTALVVAMTCGVLCASPAVASSDCYVTGTSIPAATTFVDEPFAGPFFTVRNNGGAHIHFFTQTPGNTKFMALSPGVWIVPGQNLTLKKAYVRIEYSVSPYWDGPFFFITRDSLGKIASRKEIQPKTSLNHLIINTLEAQLVWQKTETLEILTSRAAELERICWADSKAEFPPILPSIAERPASSGYGPPPQFQHSMPPKQR